MEQHQKQPKVRRGRKVYYINGMIPSAMKKVCDFYFGDFFVGLQLNEQTMTYDIVLRKKIIINDEVIDINEYADLKYFKEFWGPQFRLFWYEVDENKLNK